MSDVIIYRDPTQVTVNVVDGVPPVDQTAEVAALTAQVTQLTTDLATRTAERDALQVKITNAQAALA